MLLITLPMDTPDDKSPWTKQNIFSLIHLFPLDQTLKIKICHMVASEHTEVIEGRGQLIATDCIESEDLADDGSIDNDGADLDEEYDNGFGEADVITGVTKSATKQAEEVQQFV